MKKLIFRKIYLDISRFFLAAILIVGLIVWTIQAVNYFDFVTEDGHGLKIYFFYSLLSFPKIVQRILPFIFFVSIFYTIISYEFKNEIFIFWINGIKKITFLNRLLLFSIIFMLFQLILSSYISPLTKLEARSYLKNSSIDFFTSLIKEGKFISVTDGLTIFINSKEKDGSYKDIFLEEINKNNSKMIYADKGILYDDGLQKTLKLFDGRVINIENYFENSEEEGIKSAKVNLFDFDQINFSLQNLNSKTITVPKIQEIDTQVLLSCFLNIKNDIKNDKFKSFTCNNNLKQEITIELIKRLHKPIFIPLTVLFSCFLILYSKNEKNYKIKTNSIFMIVFFLLVYSEVSVQYFTTTINLTILYFVLPVLIFIIGYFLFNRLVKNV